MSGAKPRTLTIRKADGASRAGELAEKIANFHAIHGRDPSKREMLEFNIPGLSSREALSAALIEVAGMYEDDATAAHRRWTGGRS